MTPVDPRLSDDLDNRGNRVRVKRCKKCGTEERPTAWYRAQFERGPSLTLLTQLGRQHLPLPRPLDGGWCLSGSCPDDEHLHLRCACGYEGIAPCDDAQTLGAPYVLPVPPPAPAADRDSGTSVRDFSWRALWPWLRAPGADS